MLYEHYFIIQEFGLDLLIAGIFFLIGMSIKDVLKQSKVPPFGRVVVWSVLCFGSLGFVIKGVIEVYWSMIGLK